jgi:hypothetical protein
MTTYFKKNHVELVYIFFKARVVFYQFCPYFHNAHLELQEHMRNPIAFHAEMMGGIMYLQQVLKQPNAKEFVQGVIKEVNGHMDSNNWMLQK